MLLLTCAFALSRPATLTYSCPATKFEKLLAVLSEKTGEKLSTTSQFEGRFIVVRFKDTPVEAALARIEAAMGGKFAATSAGKTFQFDPGAKINIKPDATLSAIHKYLTNTVDANAWTSQDADKLVADALSLNDISEQSPDVWKRIESINNLGPQRRLVRRMARSIGEKVLASVPLNGRIVFSSNPNKMQRPMPADAKNVIDQYEHECQLQNEALARKGFTAENRPDTRYYVSALSPSRILEVAASGAKFVVKHSLEGLTLSMTIRGADGQADTVQSDNVLLQQFVGSEGPKPLLNVDGDFHPSPDSVLISKAIGISNNGSSSETQLTPEEDAKLKAIFKDLDKTEILTYAPSEVLLQTAEALDKDLVASLNDMSIFSFAIGEIMKDAKLQSFFGSGMTPWDVSVDETGLTVTPADILPGMVARIPRAGVGRFVSDVSKNGLSIDAVGDLDLSTPKDGTTMFSIMFGCIPFPEFGHQIMLDEGEPVLRMYAMLDQASRLKAKQDVYTVQFRALPPVLQEAVQNYVYNQSEGRDSAPIAVDGTSGARMGVQAGTDPTDMFPNGIPSNALVTFKLRKINSLFTVTKYGNSFSDAQVADEDQAANSLAWADKATSMGESQAVKLAIGDYQQLDVTISTDAGGGSHGQYRLLPGFKPNQLKDIDDLPEAMKKSMRDKFEKQKAVYKDMPIRTNPGKIKP